MKKILIISSDKQIRKTLKHFFQSTHQVLSANSRENTLIQYSKKRFELIFIDLDSLPARKKTGVDEFKKEFRPIWNTYPSAELIIITSPDKVRYAVNAVKAGAGNYLTLPINPEELRYITESLYESLQRQEELDYLRDQFWQADSYNMIRTNSLAMREVLQKIRAVAPTKTTVLLTGETGTGKGVLARLIHRHSQRNDHQFIAVHCGAIPESLIESELFGHEKGAFTGADRRRLGKFEIAQSGTIFLDEIATVSHSTQIKLLQVLQDRTFQRVGGEEVISTDVRIIAATNVDLKSLSDRGHFRTDLYYRLNVFPIEIPPLRERTEDIPLLLDVFLDKLNKHHAKSIHDVHPAVMEAFMKYSWPGNIRELENLMERAYILESGSMILPERFPNEIFQTEIHPTPFKINTSLKLAEARHLAIEEFEKHYLTQLLQKNRGRIDRTAYDAGITTRQLHKLLARYNLRKEDFKFISRTQSSDLYQKKNS